jgi:PA14 domain
MNGIIFLSGTSDKGDPMKKTLTIVVGVIASLSFAFAAPAANAQTTDEYTRQVAAAQAKIDDLQNQLNDANTNLDSWTNSSNDQANQINDAQTAATEAKDALDVAVADYQTKRNAYDEVYAQEQNAEAIYTQAVNDLNSSSDLVDNTYNDWLNAQAASDAAQADLNQAQANYNTQLINIGGTGSTPGLTVDVYTGINKYGNPPQKSDTAYTKCKTTSVTQINANWNGGDILGCGSDYIMLHYHGYITYPTTTKVYFQAPADDGFYMSINGTQVINDWSLKGCGANSTGLFSFTGGKSYPIDAWFYEWTGGACSTLNYKPLSGSSYAVAPASFFTQDSVATWVKDPTLLAVVNQKNNLFVAAVAKEEQNNQIYLNAETNYDAKYLVYVNTGQSLGLVKNKLNDANNIVANAENVWQTSSDNSVIADANLRDLKAQYATTFAGIENAAQRVTDLEAQLAQAKIDLANIPKPSASSQRKNKKKTIRAYADGAYVSRQQFVLDLK